MSRPDIAYDWPLIREQYVTADPAISLTDLGNELGIGISTMYKHSAEESWPKLRVDFQEGIVAQTQCLAIQETAKQRVTSRQVIGTAVELVKEQLEQMRQGLAGKDWSNADPEVIARASASVLNSFEKVGRFEQLLNGEADSHAQIDLATLLARTMSD